MLVSPAWFLPYSIAQLLVFREQALRQQLLDLETAHEASQQQGQQLRVTQEQVIQSTALSSPPSPCLYHSAMLMVFLCADCVQSIADLEARLLALEADRDGCMEVARTRGGEASAWREKAGVDEADRDSWKEQAASASSQVGDGPW